MRSAPHPIVRAAARGFTIIELMVGLVIGLIAILVMMQVFSISEGFKRTTSGGSDAQVTGAITMAGFQRELRQAGHGLSNTMVLGCNVTVPAGWVIAQFAPFVINPAAIPAGDPNTDVLQIAFGTGNGPTEGDRIAAQPNPATFAVATPTSFFLGDQVIAAPPVAAGGCNLRMEPVIAAPAPPNVFVATGTAGVTNGSLFNLGQQPQVLVYAVRNGNLTQCDYLINDCSLPGSVNDQNVWVPIGGDIVSLRAVYGRDDSGGIDGTLMNFDRITPVTACNWMRTTAAQVAVVTRSGTADRDPVTAAEPTWSGSGAAPFLVSTSPVPGGVDWQRFRYRVYETTVPLRNTTLVAGESGC